MANISVTVQDGNNITLVSTPTATQVITIDRGIAGPAGPAGVPGGSTTQVQYNLNSAFAGSPNFTFNGSNLVLQSASASDAFRITQTGAGNAFVVEDSANPDTTPFVINSAGTVLVGFSTAPAGGYKAYISGTGFATSAWRVGDNTDGSTSAALINLSNSTKSAQVAADPGNVGANTVLNFAVDGTTWATLNSSGNFGVGTTSPQKLLHANGTSGELLRLSVTQDVGVQQEFGLGFATSPTGVYPATQITALEFDASDSRASMLFYTRGTNSDVAPTEAMRIDSAGNVGIGTSSPTARLELTTDSLNQGIRIYRPLATSGGGYEGILFALNNTAGTKIDYAAISANSTIATLGSEAGSISFKTFGSGALTEKMRIDSAGNVGIGTTSPQATLDVVASSTNAQGLRIRGRSSDNIGGVVFTDNDGTTQRGFLQSRGDNEIRLFSGTGSANGVVTLWTSNTERMRLDSSGNLGLGVTPSAWASGSKGFQVGSWGAISSSTTSGNMEVANNAYQSSNAGVFTYVNTQAATRYAQALGNHQWYNAPSGTAGAAITFTQAMALDASGNWLLGTTTSSGRMTAGLGGGHVFNVELNGTTIGASNGVLLSNFLNQTTRVAAINLMATASDTGELVFGTASGGTLAERARIDSSGNLLVGTTSGGSYKAQIESTSFNALLLKTPIGVTQDCWQTATTGNNQFIQFYTEASATLRGSITYNRAAGQVAYNVTSDYRAKDIIGPVLDSGNLIDSVPVYMGKMKEATQERPMFIAHEVPAYAHTGVKDAVDADGKPVYQQMDTSALIPVMWAEIQDLRKRLAALEAA